MNKTEFHAAGRKLFGDKFGYRRNEKALVGEAREALLASIPALSAAKANAEEAVRARRAELLKDPEYVRLCEVLTQAKDEHSRAVSHIHSRRVTLGTVSSGAGLSFFTIKGEGDNYQEAIDDAKAKAGK